MTDSAQNSQHQTDATIRSDAHLLEEDLQEILTVSAHQVGVPGFKADNATLAEAVRLALQDPNNDAFALDHARFRTARQGAVGSSGTPGAAAPEVRPSTVYWVFRNYRGFGKGDEVGTDFAIIRQLAASIRLLLKAAIIIDDIQDDSDVRFGRPALHITHGAPLALNTACWMMMTGLHAIADCKVTEYVVSAVRNGFTGQALDLSTSLHEVKQSLASASPQSRMEFWASVAALKTSTLLQLPVNAAALALDAPEEERAVLDESMHLMGLSGQLLNDLVDFLPRYASANTFADFKGLKNRICLELLATETAQGDPAHMTPDELKSFAINHPKLPAVMLRLADDAVRFKQMAKERVFELCRSKESAAYFEAAIERVGHHVDLVAQQLHSATSFDSLLVPADTKS